MPDVSGPPPYDKFTEPDAWLAWCGDCPPSGALGPGAEDCDLEQAWWDALEFCCDERRAYAASIGLDPDDQPCNDNYVQYVWLDENCTVVDAWCGYASDVAPGIWAGAAAIVLLGLVWPDDIAQDPTVEGGSEKDGPTGSGGETGEEPEDEMGDSSLFGDSGDSGLFGDSGDPDGDDSGEPGDSGTDTGAPEDEGSLDFGDPGECNAQCQADGGEACDCMDLCGAGLCIGYAEDEGEGKVFDPYGDEDPCGPGRLLC